MDRVCKEKKELKRELGAGRKSGSSWSRSQKSVKSLKVRAV